MASIDRTPPCWPAHSIQLSTASRATERTPRRLPSTSVEIANSFRNAIYSENQRESVFGIPYKEFSSSFTKDQNNCQWAPDGDQAFDGGSYVLQFDVDEGVRLIAFKSDGNDGNCNSGPRSVSNVWLAAEEFYLILEKWRDTFETEWMSSPKSNRAFREF
jgi:hypothetical protein